MIPASPYSHLVYKDGSNFKADKHLQDGSINNLSTNTDALTVLNACKTDIGSTGYGRVHLRNADYHLSDTFDLTSCNWIHWSGENKRGTNLIPDGNYPAVAVHSYNNVMENIGILVEQGNTYTVPALKLYASNGLSLSHFDLRDMYIRHLVSSVRQQYGDAIGIILSGTGTSAWSWINGFNILTEGFLNNLHLDMTGSSGSASWCNENQFYRMKAIHCYNFFKAECGISTQHAHNWEFHGCSWQTTNVDGTTGDAFDLDHTGDYRNFNLFGGTAWDFANTNHKLLKVNSNICRVNIFGSDPSQNDYMGGSGWDNTNKKFIPGAYVRRVGIVNDTKGVTSFSADGKTTNFAISAVRYNQDTDQCAIIVTPMSEDAQGEFAVLESPTGGTFTVKYKRPPKAANPVGANNIVIGWEVMEK